MLNREREGGSMKKRVRERQLKREREKERACKTMTYFYDAACSLQLVVAFKMQLHNEI